MPQQTLTHKKSKKHKPQKPEKKPCPDCGSTNTVTDIARGELICRGCGAVLESNMIVPKYSNPVPKKVEKRTPKQSIYRLRKWHVRCRKPFVLIRDADGIDITDSYHKMRPSLNELSNKLSLPKSVRETGSVVLRTCMKQDLLKGRTTKGIVATCVYIGIRMRRLPVTLDEVASVSKIEKKTLGKYYRTIVEKLRIVIPPQDFRIFIPKYIGLLDLPVEIGERILEETGEFAKSKYLIGKNPAIIAICVIYLVLKNSEYHQTQVIIKQIGISETTLRKHCKNIQDLL